MPHPPHASPSIIHQGAAGQRGPLPLVAVAVADPPPAPAYTLVDTETALAEAMRALLGPAGPAVVAVDCEGVDLGADGAVTLLQCTCLWPRGRARMAHTLTLRLYAFAVAVATPTAAYLFDIHTLGEAAFAAGLRALLASPVCVKVMHDCRKDSAALFHRHDVRLQNVFDCQVADLFIRRAFTGLMPGYVKGTCQARARPTLGARISKQSTADMPCVR
jgi:hypothetical protein